MLCKSFCASLTWTKSFDYVFGKKFDNLLISQLFQILPQAEAIVVKIVKHMLVVVYVLAFLIFFYWHYFMNSISFTVS